MLQIDTKTTNMGRKMDATHDDWLWRDEGGSHVDLHFEAGRLVRWKIERPT